MNKKLKKQVNEWFDLYRQLKQIRAKEMELRKAITSQVLTPDLFKNGIASISLPMDEDVKIQVRQATTYSVDENVLRSIENELSDAEREAIKYKPSLKLREYKKLSEDAALHDAVVSKLAAPTIKVVI